MIAKLSLRAAFIQRVVFTAVFLLVSGGALAATAFSGVAAGDMTNSDAILWTRTFDPASGQPLAAAVTAQVATEPEFRNILFTYKGTTDPTRAGIIKIDATGLQSHTRYFYRFVSDDGSLSP